MLNNPEGSLWDKWINIFAYRMRLSLFDYTLPKQLIAQYPTRPRDNSRLLVLGGGHPPSPRKCAGLRRTGKAIKGYKISHHKFYEIEKYLQNGDVLVLNDSKVIPARLWGRRVETGGKLEVLLLREIEPDIWECLVGGARRRVGVELEFGKLKSLTKLKKLNKVGQSLTKLKKLGGVEEVDGKALVGKLIKRLADGRWQIQFNKKGGALKNLIYKVGNTPTPPYVKRQASSVSRDYQTVYAKHEGSVAAPTAGFHFTKRLINRLKKKGIQFEFVTLHVGFGTFAPVKTKNIEDHKMHAEFAILDKSTCQSLNQAKKEGRRIIAVGTTAVRVLESFSYRHKTSCFLHPGSREINLFIYPGYKFKFVDAMITNFHLPKSTLLMLVSAFAGRRLIMEAYRKAIKERYRFYSFGDAMFIACE